MNWLPLTDYTPKKHIPLVFLGNSGYVAPHHIKISSGYRAEGFADGSIQLVDCGGDLITDSGPKPTHWAYRVELEDGW